MIMIQSDVRAREKPCLRCGYSLRKSLDSKYCPECGLSVWLSLNSNDTLDWSHPEWLRKLSLASWILAAAQLCSIVPYACWGLSLLINFHWVVPAVYTGGLYLGVYGVGLLVLSTYEGRHPDRWKNYRWSCRSVAVLSFIVAAALLIGGMNLVTGHLLSLLTKATIIANCIATWAYYRKLAQRIPRAILARLSGYLALLPILPLLALFKFVPFFAIFAVFEIWNLLELVPLAYIPVTVVLLVWFARLFAKSVKSAEQGWAAETAT